MCGIRWIAQTFDFGGFESGISNTETYCVDYQLGEDIGDYVVIPTSSLDGRTSLVNRYCGQRLNPEMMQQGSSSNADVVCMIFYLM